MALQLQNLDECRIVSLAVRPVDLDDAVLARLASAIVALPRRSYRSRGVTNEAARARMLAAKGMPYEQRRFLVYAREGEPCWTCGTPVRRREAAGRGWFWCPRCQRAPAKPPR